MSLHFLFEGKTNQKFKVNLTLMNLPEIMYLLYIYIESVSLTVFQFNA